MKQPINFEISFVGLLITGNPMNKVCQEHRTGCGIACVAAMVGIEYSSVMEVARDSFGWHHTQRSFYTSPAQLQELLAAFSVKYKKYRLIKNWSSLPDCAIAGINYSEKTGNWHWVIFRREGNLEYVLDPKSKRELRTDFGRMRLMSCIPIAQ
jgi:hypothetical protein